MRKAFAWVAIFCFGYLSVALWAAPQFPALSGRVVDNANLLSEPAKTQLTEQLELHEQAHSNQVVVVTLPDLQGQSIEEFGYQLGRHWGIGQKNLDNGALLIVALKERKVRIEVGYGLEGALTDALASNIIGTQILPEFRQGQFEQGIIQGTQALLLAIKGEYQPVPTHARDGIDKRGWIALLIIVLLWWALGGGGKGGGKGGRRDNLATLGAIVLASAGRSAGNFGGMGGGFGGGGGGFGGGGASGGW